MTVRVKHSTLADGTFSSEGAIAWDADHTLTGVGTMAEQNANNVAITGGSISGVTLPASNITGTLDVGHGGTGATTLTGYVKGTGTAALTAASTIPNTDITGLGTASTKDAGAALGVATLDAGGKVPTSQIPLQGDLNYQGTWNATTNSPTLTSSTGTQGYYYVVDVAGSTDLNGITDWKVGDWAIFNGSVWQKVDNTDAVTSVNGLVGTVVLTTTNIAEGTNEYFTTARARASVSAGTAISYDNLTGVITNSAPDQVVALTGAGTTSITGTYPNFTITSNDEFDGDVVGPASATDNAIARFDTTTGKLIQNSVVTVSDTGAIAGATIITNLDYLDFDTTYNTTLGAGQLGWNGNDTLGLGMIGGNVVQHIGEDQFFYCKATATITKGQVVMFTGAVGASGVPTSAPATGITDGTYIMGIAAENIANNGFGLVQSFGTLRNINTTGYADGDILWYNPAVAGGLTKTKPVAPNVKAQMAAVINGGSAGGGTILIRINAGSTLGGSDSNAEIGSPSNGQIITYDGQDGYWKNTDLTAGTAISVAESTTGVLTINNTAPDQVVSITGGGTTTVTGTYPNFTVSSDDQYDGTVTSVDLTAGTGISVSGGPITSTGSITVTNTAPDQTVVLTAGTGISTSGTYPNFTVTNTAPDQTVAITGAGGAVVTGTYPNFTVTTPSGTVTSVTGTAPVVSSGGATPAISMAAANGSTNGYLTSTDWTTFNNKGSGTVTSVSGTSGRVTSTGGTTPVIDLATSGVSANTYGSSTAIPVITFDTYGRATTVTTAAVAGGQYYGTAATKAIAYNSNSIAEDITILANTNGLSAGPITISTGYTVTVATGAVWVIV